MDCLEAYIEFQKYIKIKCPEEQWEFPTNILDVYELLDFIRNILLVPYLLNFQALMRLYGVKMNDKKVASIRHAILHFIEKIKKS